MNLTLIYPLEKPTLAQTTSEEEFYEEEEWVEEEWEEEEWSEEGEPLEDNIEIENNLLNAPRNLDELIERRMNEDTWELMRGELPCADASEQCIRELQTSAVDNSRILQEIDLRIEEAEMRIDEARSRNEKAIFVDQLSPLLAFYLGAAPQFQVDIDSGVVERPGVIERVLGDIFSPLRLANNVLSLIGLPLFESQFGGNAAAQQRAIAIGDLQIKVAELQRGRAESADKLRERVLIEALKLDDIAREFQITQEIARRDADRMEILKVSYLFGEGNSEGYLAQLSAYDRQKAQVWREGSGLRSQLSLM
jgi:hypothetical protein